MDLNSKISDLPGVGPFFVKKFEKVGVKTIHDLFNHVPSRYLDYSKITPIKKLTVEETVTVHAKMISITNVFSKRGVRMQIGSVEDPSGKVIVVWFNQPYLVRTLYPGRTVSLSGRVGFFNRKVCLTSPDFEIIDSDDSPTLHTGRLVPVYPETSGLSSKWIRRIMQSAFNQTEILDYLPKSHPAGVIGLGEAIGFVHFPKNLEEARKGRWRLAFDELLINQLRSLLRKKKWQKNKAINKMTINWSIVQSFINSLPFKLTGSQEKAIEEILVDMGKGVPMNRLLEGDVGSGKTIVAAIGMLATNKNGFRSILMAPTQILASQHFKTLKGIFEKDIKIGLITSQTKQKDIKGADIYIGTHALLHKKMDFKKVAFIVIDEQHRFGVGQREELVRKGVAPHVLTMTATPIPRTVALTSYADLDLSILKEMPKGRLKVTTWFVPEKKRLGAYKWIKEKITKERSQVFWVCPLIEDSETETLKDVKSVTSEFERLKKVFPRLKLGLLHGRLKAREKDEILTRFKNGKLDILVATPVVEVGIDIPNAGIMVIEAGERFGLAQLHQLRGRVGRGTKKSYCLLFSNIKYSKRLNAMTKTHSGFELAELDLKLRGPGEMFGTAQSGFPELKIASWSDIELIKKTKEIAEKIVKNPKKYPELISQLRITTY